MRPGVRRVQGAQMTTCWWLVVGAAALSQAGCADAPGSAPPAQTAAEVESAGSEAPAVSATATAISDLAVVLSASKPVPPPKPTASADDRAAAQKAAIEKDLAALQLKMLAELNSQGPSTSRDLLRRGEIPPGLLDGAAGLGTRIDNARVGGDPRVGTGSGGGLAAIGEKGAATIGNKIGGKTPKELTAADLDKALAAANCTTTRLDSPVSSSGAPAAALFEAKCSDKTFNITFVPSGVTLPDAKALAEMEKNGATWNEDGMLLAILPKEKGARAAALELMKKLRSSGSNSVKGNAAVGGATVSGGSVSNAASVVAGMAAGFRRCYNRGLQDDPTMKGSMKVTAGIGPNGEVLSAAPSGGDTLSATVKSCVSARVSAAQFAAPDGGSATITIPLSFFPQ